MSADRRNNMRHGASGRAGRTGSAGQTILEAVIAAGIVATAVSAALTLVQSSINGEKESEFGIIGTNLAREGIEVVRMIRDSNWLAGRPWDQGLEGAEQDYTGIPVFSTEDNNWTMDFTPDELPQDAARVYRFTSGEAALVGLNFQTLAPSTEAVATNFNRLVELDPICADRTIKTSGEECGAGNDKIGIRATARVTWYSGGRRRTIAVEETLYDWR